MPDLLDQLHEKTAAESDMLDQVAAVPPSSAAKLAAGEKLTMTEAIGGIGKGRVKAWSLFKKGTWTTLGVIAWPFERIEYTIATPLHTAFEARKETLSERGIDIGFGMVQPRLIRRDELVRETQDVLKTLAPIAKAWIPGRKPPEAVKTFNDFFGSYYHALTGEPAPEWYKSIAGTGASVLVVPFLFGKVLKGIAKGGQAVGKVTGISQKIQARNLPAWKALKVLARADTGVGIEKAQQLGKSLGNQQIRSLAKELSKETGRKISSRAVKLRLTQIIKGGITTRPELANKANPVIETLVHNQAELKALGILPEYTYISKLPKKEIAALLKEKKVLEAQLEKLAVGKKVISQFPGKEAMVQKLAGRLNVLDDQIKAFATKAKPTHPGLKLNLARTRTQEFIDLLAEKNELKRLGRSTKAIDTKIAGYIKPGVVHEAGYIPDGIPERLSKLIARKQEAMKRLKRITEAKLVRPRFPGRTEKIRKLEEKIAKISDRVMTSYKQGGTKYFPRMYLSKEEALTAQDASRYAANRIRAKYALKRQKIPEDVRKAMGEIKEPGYPIAKRLIQETHDIETAKLFQFAAKNPKWVSDKWMPGFARKALPDTKAYGALRGKFVISRIHGDVTELVRTKRTLEVLYDTGIGYWKLGKVVFNPATHFRNMFSNSILLDLSGMDHIQQVKYFTKAMQHIKKGSAEYQTAKKFFMRTTLVRGEIFDDMLRSMNEAGGGGLAKVINGTNRFVGKAAKGPAEVYQAEEFTAKFMKYLSMRDKGATPQQAIAEANKWLFDYSDLARWEKNIARRIMPFYTFPRKALPRVLEAAANRPFVLAKYPLLAKSMTQFSLYKLDITERDWTTIQEDLPEHMKNGSYILMPYRDKNGDLRFFDWTYVVPWGELYDAQERGILKVGITNPLFQLVADIRANKSGWTGRAIYDDAILPEKQTEEYRGEQNLKKMLYVWQGLVPSLAYKGIYWDKLYAAATGKKIRGKDMLLPETIAHTLFGLRTQAIDPQEERRWNLLRMMKGFDELRGNMLRVTMQRSNGDIDEEEYNEKMNIYLDQLQKFHTDAIIEEEELPSIEEVLDAMDNLMDEPIMETKEEGKNE